MTTSQILDFGIRPELKRKRANESDETSSSKRTFTHLPFRSPPSSQERPSISITPAFPSSAYQPTRATPDSASESGSRPDDVWSESSQTRRSHSNSDTSNSSVGDASLRIQVDHDVSMEMELSSIPKLSRIGRARSNDLMSPVRERPASVNSAPRPVRFNSDDRVPTPVASCFSERNPYETTLGSSHSIPSRTTLTPMMTEETWTPRMNQQRSFSLDAGCEQDVDNMMMVEDTNSGLSGLSMECTYDVDDAGHHMNDDSQQRKLIGLGVGNTPDSSGRTARLHMGFRSDCEKCIQRVPGHYSHILWS